MLAALESPSGKNLLAFYDSLGDLTARHNSGRVTPEELGRLLLG